MRFPRFVPAIIAIVLGALGAGPVAAVETILQNDGFVAGQAVGFQAGFVAGEIGASRLVPSGTGPWRVNRVRFLLGGATSTVTITLRIWDDTAGTGVPGTELFFGDYLVTGSDAALQEIDLVADNVLVTGQFRVGIEFQHDGLPSIARDGDGTITASRNFIYTPSIPGWVQSSLFGLTGDWVIRAGVEEVSGGGPDAPQILSVADVGNDQGKQVRIRFQRSGQDAAGAATPVLHYEVHRRVDALPVTIAADRTASRPPLLPSAVALDGWDYVASVPAHGDDVYSVVVPTLADSSISQGLQWSVFFIRAATAAPTTVFDSPADSGYSVDNLPPVPPVSFAADYSGGATHLLWDPNSEPDLWYYALHRGSSADFLPGPGNLIATTSGSGYDDVGPAGSYYKLAAVDVNGNTSGYTLAASSTTGVPEEGASAFALTMTGANPSRDGRLRLGLTLPTGAPARLEVLDVSGRRVLSRDVGSLGAGRHTVVLSAGGPLTAGIYLVRLSDGINASVVRAVVME